MYFHFRSRCSRRSRRFVSVRAQRRRSKRLFLGRGGYRGRRRGYLRLEYRARFAGWVSSCAVEGFAFVRVAFFPA